MQRFLKFRVLRYTYTLPAFTVAWLELLTVVARCVPQLLHYARVYVLIITSDRVRKVDHDSLEATAGECRYECGHVPHMAKYE